MIALTWVIDLPRTAPSAEAHAHAQTLGAALAASDGLLAGITAVGEAGQEGADNNAYASFTIWANSSRLSAFLWGDAMASVERDFARPSGRLWAVSSVQMDRAKLLNSTHAGLLVTAATPGQTLKAIVDDHKGSASRSVAGRSTGLACRGLDVSSWDEAQIEAWTGRPRGFEGRVFQVVTAAVPERG